MIAVKKTSHPSFPGEMGSFIMITPDVDQIAPSFFPTFVNFSIANSICSFV